MKVTNIRRKLLAALVAGGVLAPSAAEAAPLDTNLVVNGSFENVDVGTTGGGYNAVLILDWGGATPGFAYSYDGSGGAPDYSNGAPLTGSGSYYFTPGAGGNQSLANALTQDIDVSTGDSGSLIAGGMAGFNLSADFSSFSTQDDRGVVEVDFLGSGGGTLGSTSIGPPGNLSTWTHLATGGLIPVGTETVRIASYGVLLAGGSSDGYTDNIDFLVSEEVNIPTLDIEIDRGDSGGSGSITLRNRTGAPVHISGYSITSAFGALVPDNWLSIAENYDADNDGSVDGSNSWSELTQPDARGDLSEGDLDTGTGTILDNGDSINLGNADVWIQNPNEDLVFEFISNGVVETGILQFVGNGGQSFADGDLDFDNDIDVDDWVIFRAGQQANMSGLSLAEAYHMGDLTGDRQNNHPDFVVFKRLFDTENGDGAFAAMLDGVPEPSSLILLVGTGLALLGMSRTRRTS